MLQRPGICANAYGMSNATSAAPRTPRQKLTNVAMGRLYRPRVFNQQSRGRFERERISELIRHLGRMPTYPEKIIMDRICRVEWELRRTDARLDAGHELSGHDIRGRLAAETRLRLDLLALGLEPGKPVEERIPSYAEHVAARDAKRAPPAKRKQKPSRKPPATDIAELGDGSPDDASAPLAAAAQPKNPAVLYD
jgi:hypothetical protein